MFVRELIGNTSRGGSFSCEMWTLWSTIPRVVPAFPPISETCGAAGLGDHDWLAHTRPRTRCPVGGQPLFQESEQPMTSEEREARIRELLKLIEAEENAIKIEILAGELRQLLSTDDRPSDI